MTADSDVEERIARWRAYVEQRRKLPESDITDSEARLRGSVTELTAAGLAADEAFLIAVKRLGGADELLWKQLVPLSDAAARNRVTRPDLVVMVGCAVASAVAVKLPVAFGVDLDGHPEFYGRNAALFAFAPLAVYFAIRHRLSLRVVAMLAGLFGLGAVAANAYPLGSDSQSLVLTAIHLPIALWLVTGVAYTAGAWRSGRRRMDFIRFTGEWFIYFVLICLGGGVLIGVTLGTFDAIGVDAEEFVSQWLLPCGGVAAVVVAAWPAEGTQNVVGNIAPLLTKVFTPLFTAVLLALLAGIGLSGRGIDVDRDALILFDVLLALVLALLLYSISAREPAPAPGAFDRLQLALVVSALLVDVLVLAAVAGRITEWGSTPNRIAALGENLILLANLAWSARLLFGFLRRRTPFGRLEQWQTRYLVIYAVWAWAVVLVFPPLFDFL
ncbi:hypothetical protein [Nocardia huaxiensis]|uniref:DUF4153 domain-containing protein n=1 Tax=Nocardia huaxiensis TaxID=2755382 RepID=A0A7D6VE51_9NOCA|nr:hypothetical protein [Nocardia huaxiensis]QLY33151.1 hypothetical protein H0264_13760 [Nocardia huaxiensis]UFS93077.1 hypothetical protein LPY97_19600 [Nocardia huaxiensis]